MTYGGETCAFAYVLRVQTVFPKNELFRVVKTPDGKIFLDDEKGKTNGRGAYICKSEQCVAKCAKSKILNRQLGETDEEVYAELKDKI